jgi:hypothetical protein
VAGGRSSNARKLTAEVSTELVGAAYEKPMLTVEFADGSIVGLHVPSSQRPDAFVASVRRA